MSRIRRRKWARPELEKDPKVIFQPQEYQGKWPELFKNQNPIHLELGCGQGEFISQCAENNPHLNFIAIDLYNEVLVQTLRKLNENSLENVRLIPMNIRLINEIFAEDEVAKIYINFCNPWPKRRHHIRRLTHPVFLEKYKKFLINKGEVCFKTDDDGLFQDSLKYFAESGFKELYKTFDLHSSSYAQNNIVTKYEEKFSSQGIKIKFGIFQNNK
ncbi:MAG: tRNA (guanosine(46)-N7)-methyltransferase TrmB [Desulfitobacterium sp.]|nr:tRNA (guanosine(46)-N7)-methyltransferase TrmB [Desulfitobacterium sp.]